MTVALSVVMPAYNEEGAIAAAVAEIRECILARHQGSELVVVDDGSRDRTGAILDELAAADPRIRAVHRVNGGHGAALFAGIAASRGELVFLVDADRQIPLDGFARAYERIRAGDDVVTGIRRGRDDPRHRLVLSVLVRWSLVLLFGVRIRDANVPYKLFRRQVWDEVRAHLPDDTLMPSLSLVVCAKKAGRRVTEVEVPHRARTTGTGSLRPLKLARVCLRTFAQCVALRGRLKRSQRPSRGS